MSSDHHGFCVSTDHFNIHKIYNSYYYIHFVSCRTRLIFTSRRPITYSKIPSSCKKVLETPNKKVNDTPVSMNITKTAHNNTEIDNIDVSKLKISDPLESSSVQDLTKATYRDTLLAWKEKGKKYPSASSMRGNKIYLASPAKPNHS